MKKKSAGCHVPILAASANLLILLLKFGQSESYISVPKTRGDQQATHGKIWQTTSDEDAPDKVVSKRIVFIRHGRTYMNDLINGVHYGKPGFTDVFPDTPEYDHMYNDSPLSPTGLEQVQVHHQRLQDLAQKTPGAHEALALDEEDASFLQDLELVVASPLTRALQTLEMGLYPHIQSQSSSREVPILALPLAAERVYLVSDLGRPRSELKKQYAYVDFDSGFPADHGEEDPWHFVPSEDDADNYVEWRPHGEDQVYACLGEPQHRFDRRMSELYRWLESREERTIAVVCHAGVIDWMVQEIFENCELRVVPFKELKPRALQAADEMCESTAS